MDISTPTSSDGKAQPSANLLADDLLDATYAYLDWRDLLRAQVCRRWRAASARAQAFPSSSVLPQILGYFDWRELMRIRGTCTQWREAVTRTLVPPTIKKRRAVVDNMLRDAEFEEFHVRNARAYKMLDIMRKALPNLQQIRLSKFGGKNRYLEGDEPDLEALKWTEDRTAYDVNIISDFKNLRSLILKWAPLNGRYPSLFGFQNLRELSVSNGDEYCDLRWELKMLSGMPKLEQLTCNWSGAAGSLSDLRFLKDSLRELTIITSFNGRDAKINGDFMDLADFSSLEKLDLEWATEVKGDVSRIQATDFPSLGKLDLPGVIVSIQQSSEIIDVFADLAKRTTIPCISSVRLSRESSDHYEKDHCFDSRVPIPPFKLEIVEAGTRLGWRWTSKPRWGSEHRCEIQWFDSRPGGGSKNRQIDDEDGTFYDGICAPPSAAEYHEMCRVYQEERNRRSREIMDSIRRRSEPAPTTRNGPTLAQLGGMHLIG